MDAFIAILLIIIIVLLILCGYLSDIIVKQRKEVENQRKEVENQRKEVENQRKGSQKEDVDIIRITHTLIIPRENLMLEGDEIEQRVMYELQNRISNEIKKHIVCFSGYINNNFDKKCTATICICREQERLEKL